MHICDILKEKKEHLLKEKARVSAYKVIKKIHN